ncbi:unnamed protein product [Fraxinus pennsylvanica]|uniref:Plant bHLH transcription factor ACT-like domain-containing protein n=1 Tax=Fraxinus pennsylvanica TaxID=56036 RepID=A0AAD2A3M6_9LAMI|nr:unnamed protein product [Fraxinus pennsylvanica]
MTKTFPDRRFNCDTCGNHTTQSLNKEIGSIPRAYETVSATSLSYRSLRMDKEISALEKAIRYMEYLQKRVKILEEQARKAEIVTKNSQVVVDDNVSSSTELQQPPTIKASECGKNVLLRIHCEKREGILVKILDEVEKLNLGIVNTNVVSFGSLSLEVSITAEKEKEFSATVNEIVKSVDDVLQSAA